MIGEKEWPRKIGVWILKGSGVKRGSRVCFLQGYPLKIQIPEARKLNQNLEPYIFSTAVPGSAYSQSACLVFISVFLPINIYTAVYGHSSPKYVLPYNAVGQVHCSTLQ